MFVLVRVFCYLLFRLVEVLVYVRFGLAFCLL